MTCKNCGSPIQFTEWWGWVHLPAGKQECDLPKQPFKTYAQPSTTKTEL